MPTMVDGIGTSIFRSLGTLRRGKGKAKRTDCDAVACFAIFFPLIPYQALHVWGWKGRIWQAYGEVIQQDSYKSIPIRWSFRLAAGVLLGWWLWLPLLFGFVISLSPILAWPWRVYGFLLWTAALGLWIWLPISDVKNRQLRRLLGRHQLGTSDPASWTEDVLKQLAPPPAWFATPTFAAAVPPLLAAGLYCEAMWAARLTVALEDPVEGERLTARVLSAPGVQELLGQLKRDPAQAKTLLRRWNPHPFPLWSPGADYAAPPDPGVPADGDASQQSPTRHPPLQPASRGVNGLVCVAGTLGPIVLTSLIAFLIILFATSPGP